MGFDFKKTKKSAVCQIVLGSLCLLFGIFDRVFIYKYRWRAFHTEGVIAIWMGVWFLITGIIGYIGSKPHQNTQRPQTAIIGTYMGFSIVATVFAGVLIICYSIGLVSITRGRSCTRYKYKCDYYDNCRYVKVDDRECQRSVGLGAMIIIFAVVEFGVSIWASVCCCSGSGGGCCCDTPTPQTGQVVYLQTQEGSVAAYVMTQGPNGMPVAVPAMIAGTEHQATNQITGNPVYLMQNPQGGTNRTPTQYIQRAGGQPVGQGHMQNSQGAAIVIPSQQGAQVTSGGQHPETKTTNASSEAPPAYTP